MEKMSNKFLVSLLQMQRMDNDLKNMRHEFTTSLNEMKESTARSLAHSLEQSRLINLRLEEVEAKLADAIAVITHTKDVGGSWPTPSRLSRTRRMWEGRSLWAVVVSYTIEE